MKISIATNGTTSYETFHVIELHLDQDVLQSLTFTTKAVATSGPIASLLVGCYFKSALYLYMYDKRKGLSERPIDAICGEEYTHPGILAFSIVCVWITDICSAAIMPS